VLITTDISVVFLFADSVPRSGRFGSLFDPSVGDFLLDHIHRHPLKGPLEIFFKGLKKPFLPSAG